MLYARLENCSAVIAKILQAENYPESNSLFAPMFKPNPNFKPRLTLEVFSNTRVWFIHSYKTKAQIIFMEKLRCATYKTKAQIISMEKFL